MSYYNYYLCSLTRTQHFFINVNRNLIKINKSINPQTLIKLNTDKLIFTKLNLINKIGRVFFFFCDPQTVFLLDEYQVIFMTEAHTLITPGPSRATMFYSLKMTKLNSIKRVIQLTNLSVITDKCSIANMGDLIEILQMMADVISGTQSSKQKYIRETPEKRSNENKKTCHPLQF